MANYLNTLDPTHPNSIENHTQPGGVGAPAPQQASDSSTNPVNANEVTSEVKNKNQVAQGDIVVGENVPPPTGEEQQKTQTATSTATTTQNPDGSETTEETTTLSCFANEHDPRTVGSILEAHHAVWASSGLLGAVEQLKTLTWPDTLPVIVVGAGPYSSFTINFNDWAWAFSALRVLVIAGAGFVAVRLVFGGRS